MTALALPGLRQELRIEPGAPLVSGAPSWTLFDPVRHLFFQLGRVEFRILSHWAAGTMSSLNETLAAEGIAPDEIDGAVGQVVDFSLRNGLTVAPLGNAVATFTQQARRQRKAWWRWLVDNYLFIRVPLVRPAAFLRRNVHRVAPLWSRTGLLIFAAMALVGLLMVARQWDAFVASFAYFFTWQGLGIYLCALALVKVAHELGHAFQATRFGVPVPAMGISFLVMMPVLYTDTTGAWRLRSRRKRLAIDCAGVAVELMIASIATLAWVLLPEGMLRSAAFVLATSSWLMSLAINLNPFMRYDGYYVLADLLSVPNLQPRAFALARWRLRELLFSLGDAPPEQVPDRLRRVMIVYAWVTWIYRLVLFVGIALLVYHLFFKALGIVLFAIEITVFVLRPIFAEVSAWWARRADILATRRGRRWPWILGGIAILTVLPLDRHVTAPAVLSSIGAAPLVAGDPARVEAVLVTDGQRVAAGTPIAVLRAPEIDRDAARARVNVAEYELQLARAVADLRDLSNRGVLERLLAGERGTLSGLEARRARLVLRAPIAGVVADLDATMRPGRWLGGAEVVARIVTPDQYDVQAYVDEDDVWRIEDGASARFVPDDPTQASRRAKVVERAASATQTLDQPILASVNGGAIAVNRLPDAKLKPRQVLYRVRLLAERGALNALPQVVPGRIVVDARGESLLERLARSFTSVLRREASIT